MIPYQGLLFFYIMGLALLPAILLGLLGRPIKQYGLLFTVVLLLWIFAINEQLKFLTVFFIWQMGLCLLFFHRKNKARWKLCLFLTLAILPLALVKAGEILTLPYTFQLLGISYMTFRSVQVLIDSYNGSLKKLDVFCNVKV